MPTNPKITHINPKLTMKEWNRLIRQHLGLIRKDVARQAQVSLSTMKRWDQGYCKDRIDRMHYLCYVLDIDFLTELVRCGVVTIDDIEEFRENTAPNIPQ